MQITRLDRLARLGYFARAIIYGLLGYLALTTSRLAHKGPQGEFELLGAIPGGRIVLLGLAVGLLSYGLYKLIGALLDIDGNGRSTIGLLKRAAFAGGGTANLALCWVAVKFASGMTSTAGQSGKREAAGEILKLPLGNLALAAVGAGFLLAAAIQVRSAVVRRFMRHLPSDAPSYTCTVGRVGLAARAVVFALIGWSILQSAWRNDENQVRDLGGALVLVHENPFLYLSIAAGLILFAGYSAIEGRYRIVPPIDAVEAGKQIAVKQ